MTRCRCPAGGVPTFDCPKCGALGARGTARSAGTWGVWCEVNDGRTGFRQAWLKVDGKLLRCDRAEAEATARQAQRLAECHVGATFNYQARQVIEPGGRITTADQIREIFGMPTV